jgi:DNA-binding response OmpR family regulator
MVVALSDLEQSTRPSRPTWQRLPPRMRVLYIGPHPQAGQWLAEAFAADSATKVVLEEAVGTAAGLSRLRDEVFDAVLVGHEPGVLDALDLVEGYRTGGAEEPIVIFGAQSEHELAPLCYEVGADGYVCTDTTTRNLIWVVARAVQRHQLVCENRRLALAEHSRLQRERDEAAGLLEQERALISSSGESPAVASLPDELVAHHRELLRTYVIMGSGNLASVLQHLASVLINAGISPTQTVALHLHVLEELVQGLGTRSARHVMSRADLLIFQLLLLLADGYRTKLMIEAC